MRVLRCPRFFKKSPQRSLYIGFGLWWFCTVVYYMFFKLTAFRFKLKVYVKHVINVDITKSKKKPDF